MSQELDLPRLASVNKTGPTTLWDGSGKEYVVRHTVDAREWLATGRFFEAKPEPKNAEVSAKK